MKTIGFVALFGLTLYVNAQSDSINCLLKQDTIFDSTISEPLRINAVTTVVFKNTKPHEAFVEYLAFKEASSDSILFRYSKYGSELISDQWIALFERYSLFIPQLYLEAECAFSGDRKSEFGKKANFIRVFYVYPTK